MSNFTFLKYFIEILQFYTFLKKVLPLTSQTLKITYEKVKKYWKKYNSGELYDYSDQMDAEIESDVKNAVRYLGINKTFVTIYVREDDDSDAGN